MNEIPKARKLQFMIKSIDNECLIAREVTFPFAIDHEIIDRRLALIAIGITGRCGEIEAVKVQ